MYDFSTTPPTLYFSADIITMDEALPPANAMYVKDGIIEQIGELESISSSIPESIRKVDLNGATIMPGFIDPHTHFMLTVLLYEMHDLSGFAHSSNTQVWESFEEKVRTTPKGEWVVCKGIDPVLIPNLEIPTIEYLDEVSPENPVLFLSQSLHSYWANSLAFEKAGITRNTPDPSHHSFYEKDEYGDLTGLVVEQQAIGPILKIVQDEYLTTTKLSKAASIVANEYAKNGNTTIVSAGLTISDEKPLLLLKHLFDKKRFLIGSVLEKIGMLPSRQALPRHFIYMRHDMTDLLPERGKTQNDFYNILGVKHWYDGSPYIGTMYLDSAYMENEFNQEKLDIPSVHNGEPLIEKETLKEFISTHHNNGWQIAIHTQGDAAITEVLDAYEELSPELDFSNSRHRLEHCLLMPRSELDRVKLLNLTPSYHINHLYYYGNALNQYVIGEQRSNKMLPLKSTSEKDITFTLHADQPMFPSEPFRLIQTAIERKTKSEISINEVERIDLLQAIKALTIDAAWQINMEDKIGSLEEGKFADFIVLDRNPFETPIRELEDIRCLKTFVNGNEIR